VPQAVGAFLGVYRPAALRGARSGRRAGRLVLRVRQGTPRLLFTLRLFWEPIGKDTIAVAMGAFDAPTGTQLALHIFVDDKGDYYEIADGLPQNRQ